MYRAPVSEIAFALKASRGPEQAIDAGALRDLSGDLVDAVLEEAGRFATEEIAPLNKVGDKHGAPLKDGKVTTPPGWKETYQAWCEGGWNAIAAPEEFGGQGLPVMLAVAALEMWNSASMAFGLGPTADHRAPSRRSTSMARDAAQGHLSAQSSFPANGPAP